MPMEFSVQSPSLELKRIIKAGAGAGKTTTLVTELYQYFVNFKTQNKKAPKIIVTTFTKKATQELKERLLKKAIEENNEDFFSYINNKNLIFISTIHGVLNLFLKQNAESFGFRKNIEILSESDEELLFEKNLRTLLVDNDELASLLQNYSVSELYQFCMDYQELVKVEPNFNFYTELEFREYIEKNLKDILQNFDSVTLRLSQEKITKSWELWVQSYRACKKEGYQWLIDWNEEQGAKPRKGKEDNEPVYSLQVQFTDTLDRLRKIIEQGYLTPQILDGFDAKMQKLKKLGDSFVQLSTVKKQQSSQISLRDIEFLTVEDLEKNKEIYFQFSNEWDFWMIDEYQDTSPLQEKILQVLIGKSPHFLVGDPQQSIYLFRGARSEIFQEKFAQYSQLNQSLTLIKNYRSAAGVLNFINSFFTSEFNQFQAMEITKPESAQDFDLQYLEYNEDIALSDAVCVQLQSLIEKGCELDEIVVLSRTNKELIELEKKLKILGMPYFYHSSGNFYKKRETLDILMFIKFLYNPFDDLNLLSLMRTPWIGFSESEVYQLKQQASAMASFVSEVFKLSADPRASRLQKYLEQFSQVGLNEVLKRFLFESGLLLTAHHKDESGQRESNIWKLVNWVQELSSQSESDILTEIDFLLRSSLMEMELASESSAILEPKRIQLMTVHASKGLQFKHVLLLSADIRPKSTNVRTFSKDEEQKKWSFVIKNPQDDSNVYSPLALKQKAFQSDKELDEFWRLLYVAVTRAKEQILVFSDEKPDGNSWAERIKSFLQQIKNPNFKFQFATVKKEEIDSLKTLVAKTANQSQILFDPTLIYQNSKQERSQLSEAISYTSSHKYFDFKKSISGVLKKESGVDLHFNYEKSDQHLPLLEKIDPNVPWKQILKQGHKEFGFSFIYEEKKYTGSIDLWAQIGTSCYLIDYKTGDKVDSTGHFNQLMFYAQALKHLKIINSSEVQLIVCYMTLEKSLKKTYQLVDLKTYLEGKFSLKS